MINKELPVKWKQILTFKLIWAFTNTGLRKRKRVVIGYTVSTGWRLWRFSTYPSRFYTLLQIDLQTNDP